MSAINSNELGNAIILYRDILARRYAQIRVTANKAMFRVTRHFALSTPRQNFIPGLITTGNGFSKLALKEDSRRIFVLKNVLLEITFV